MTALGLHTVFISLPFLLSGALTTIEIVAASLLIGVLCGLAAGFARLSRTPAVRALAATYISVVRGTPFVVQLFIAYYALPQIGLPIPAMVAAIGALAVYSGAYQAEIVRGAIQSIDRRQLEGAVAIGLSPRQAMTLVVFPQALLRMLPPLGNEFVALTKNSALVSLVTVRELFMSAQMIISSTFQNFSILLTVAALYYGMTSIVGGLTRRLERQLQIYS